MSRNETIYLITTPEADTLHARFKWTVSRGRDTYGYSICSLYIDGEKVTMCNGGGYDMEGTCLGHWLAAHARDKLLQLTDTFPGLSFHDPDFDPGKAVPDHAAVFGNETDVGKTVEQLEAEGKSLGLERYQQFLRASAKLPTERHRMPLIDGAVGINSVMRIGKAVGYAFKYVS